MACIVRNQINLWTIPHNRNHLYNVLAFSTLMNFAAQSMIERLRNIEDLGIIASYYTGLFAYHDKAHKVAASALALGTTFLLNHSFVNRSIGPAKIMAVALAGAYIYASCTFQYQQKNR